MSFKSTHTRQGSIKYNRTPGVKVIVKCRPLLGNEKTGLDKVYLDEQEALVTIVEQQSESSSPHESSYRFDGIFASTTPNHVISDSFCDPFVCEAISEHKHFSMLLFGARNSGKTTLFVGNEGNPGLVECICRSIFRFLQREEEGQTLSNFLPNSSRTSQNNSHHQNSGVAKKIEYRTVVSVSFFEVSQGKLRDLLRPNNSEIAIDPDAMVEVSGTCVVGASSFRVQSWTMVRSVFDAGARARTPHHSHGFFHVTLERFSDNGSRRCVSLLLCDLAANDSDKEGNLGNFLGSENGGGLSNNNGGGGLNGLNGGGESGGGGGGGGDGSSAALTACLAALSDPKGQRSPPFDKSVLTQVLEPSLSSTTHNLLIITTIAPAAPFAAPTLRSIKYATRAKYIRRTTPGISQGHFTGANGDLGQHDPLSPASVHERKRFQDMLFDLKQELRAMTQTDDLDGNGAFVPAYPNAEGAAVGGISASYEAQSENEREIAARYHANIVRNYEERTELAHKVKEIGNLERAHEALVRQKQLERQRLVTGIKLSSSREANTATEEEQARLRDIDQQLVVLEAEFAEVRSMSEKFLARLKRKEDEAQLLRNSVPAGVNVMVGDKKNPLYSKFLEVELIEMGRQLTFRDQVIDEYSRQAREHGVDIAVDPKLSRRLSKNILVGTGDTVLETERSYTEEMTARTRERFTTETAVKALDDLRARRNSRQSTGSISNLAIRPPQQQPSAPEPVDDAKMRKRLASDDIRQSASPSRDGQSNDEHANGARDANYYAAEAAKMSAALSNLQNARPTAGINVPPQTAQQMADPTIQVIASPTASRHNHGNNNAANQMSDPLEQPLNLDVAMELGGKAMLVGVRRTRPVSWNAPAHAVVRRAQNIEDVYRMGKELGSGGFSVVRRGTNLITGEEFALKIIKNDVFKKNQRHVESEVHVIAGFDHPKLVKMKEVIRTPEHFVLVTELVEGGELFNRIVEMKKFSEDTTRDIMTQLLEAVEVLHLNGVLHRDLKPENILIDTNACGDDPDKIAIKLTDFGLAVHFDANNPISLLAGTPEYAAPEVLSRKPYGYPCDMWSLGVILYIMLCGFPPFYGKTPQEVIEKVKSGTYTFPAKHWASISVGARDLVKRLLDVNPDTRLTIDQVRNHKWMKVGLAAAEVSNGGGMLADASEMLKRFNATRKQQQQQYQQQPQQPDLSNPPPPPPYSQLQPLPDKSEANATNTDQHNNNDNPDAKRPGRRSITNAIKSISRSGSRKSLGATSRPNTPGASTTTTPRAPGTPVSSARAMTPRTAAAMTPRSAGARSAGPLQSPGALMSKQQSTPATAMTPRSAARARGASVAVPSTNGSVTPRSRPIVLQSAAQNAQQPLQSPRMRAAQPQATTPRSRMSTPARPNIVGGAAAAVAQGGAPQTPRSAGIVPGSPRRASLRNVPPISDPLFAKMQNSSAATREGASTPNSRRSTGSPVRALYDRLRGGQQPGVMTPGKK